MFVATVTALFLFPVLYIHVYRHTDCSISVSSIIYPCLSPHRLFYFQYYISMFIAKLIVLSLFPLLYIHVCRHTDCSISISSIIYPYLSPHWLFYLCFQYYIHVYRHTDCSISVSSIIYPCLSPHWLFFLCFQYYISMFIATLTVLFLFPVLYIHVYRHIDCFISVSSVIYPCVSPHWLFYLCFQHYLSMFIATLTVLFLFPVLYIHVYRHIDCFISVSSVIYPCVSPHWLFYLCFQHYLSMFIATLTVLFLFPVLYIHVYLHTDCFIPVSSFIRFIFMFIATLIDCSIPVSSIIYPCVSHTGCFISVSSIIYPCLSPQWLLYLCFQLYISMFIATLTVLSMFPALYIPVHRWQWVFHLCFHHYISMFIATLAVLSLFPSLYIHVDRQTEWLFYPCFQHYIYISMFSATLIVLSLFPALYIHVYRQTDCFISVSSIIYPCLSPHWLFYPCFHHYISMFIATLTVLSLFPVLYIHVYRHTDCSIHVSIIIYPCLSPHWLFYLCFQHYISMFIATLAVLSLFPALYIHVYRHTGCFISVSSIMYLCLSLHWVFYFYFQYYISMFIATLAVLSLFPAMVIATLAVLSLFLALYINVYRHTDCFISVSSIIYQCLSPHWLFYLCFQHYISMFIATLAVLSLFPALYIHVYRHTGCFISVSSIMYLCLSLHWVFYFYFQYYISMFIATLAVLSLFPAMFIATLAVLSLFLALYINVYRHTDCFISVSSIIYQCLSPHWLFYLCFHHYISMFIATLTVLYMFPTLYIHGYRHTDSSISVSNIIYIHVYRHIDCSISVSSNIYPCVSPHWIFNLYFQYYISMFVATLSDCPISVTSIIYSCLSPHWLFNLYFQYYISMFVATLSDCPISVSSIIYTCLSPHWRFYLCFQHYISMFIATLTVLSLFPALYIHVCRHTDCSVSHCASYMYGWRPCGKE